MTETPTARARAQFAGAGGLPTAYNILLLTATITVHADTTIGDGTPGDGLADAVVRRDPASGLCMIPAPSLAGVLRHRLAEVLGESEETGADTTLLFGDTDRAAALRPQDSLAAPGTLTTWRIGNAVDPARRTVHPGAVFTDEILPAGSELGLRWEVRLPDSEYARRILELTLLAATLLDEGEIRVGRRTSTGRGVLRTSGWRGRWFALGSRGGDVIAWYSTPYDRKPELVRGRVSSSTAFEVLQQIGQSAPTSELRRPLTRPRVDVGQRLTLTATMLIEEKVRNAKITATATATTLTPAGDAVDSGAAVKNLLRGIATRAGEFIATGAGAAVAPTWPTEPARNRARELVLGLFGPHISSDNPTTPAAARISVDEAVLTGAVALTVPRTPINPLTHGVITGLLGAAPMVYGGSRELTVTIRAATRLDRALLLLIVKDLCDSLIPASGPHRRRLDPRSLRLRHELAHADPQQWEQWNSLSTDATLRDDLRQLVDWIRYGREDRE